MSASLRREVLQAFKSLHKARKHVFKDDLVAIDKARVQINVEYKKCKNVRDVESIRELISHSKAVENELLTTIIQVKEIQPGKFEAQIRDQIVKLDNVPFKQCTK